VAKLIYSSIASLDGYIEDQDGKFEWAEAARDGKFQALLELLDPEVVLRRDIAPLGGSSEVLGARAVAGQALAYSRLGVLMRPVLVNRAVGAVAILEGEPFAVGAFTVRDGKIAAIDIIADPERLGSLDLTVLDD
jgi:hypothetical protein